MQIIKYSTWKGQNHCFFCNTTIEIAMIDVSFSEQNELCSTKHTKKYHLQKRMINVYQHQIKLTSWQSTHTNYMKIDHVEMNWLQLNLCSVTLLHPSCPARQQHNNVLLSPEESRSLFSLKHSCCKIDIAQRNVSSFRTLHQYQKTLGVLALGVIKNYSICHKFGSSMAKEFLNDSQGKIDDSPKPLPGDQISVNHNLWLVNNLASELTDYGRVSCYFFILSNNSNVNILSFPGNMRC